MGIKHHSFLTEPMNVFLCIMDESKREPFLSGHDRYRVDQNHHYPFLCTHLCEDKVQLTLLGRPFSSWDGIKGYDLVLGLAWHLAINREIIGKK